MNTTLVNCFSSIASILRAHHHPRHAELCDDVVRALNAGDDEAYAHMEEALRALVVDMGELEEANADIEPWVLMAQVEIEACDGGFEYGGTLHTSACEATAAALVDYATGSGKGSPSAALLWLESAREYCVRDLHECRRELRYLYLTEWDAAVERAQEMVRGE